MSKMKIRVHESKKSEGYNDYAAIRDWLETVMEKAGTMFESAYVSENGRGSGEICIEIEGYDSTGGDAIISLVFDESDTLEDTIASIDEELSEYAEDFDPDDEAKMYADSDMAGVPPLRELIKAMDERKEDMRTLSDAVHKAYREMV